MTFKEIYEWVSEGLWAPNMTHHTEYMLMNVPSSGEGPQLSLAYKVIRTSPKPSQVSLHSLGEYVGLTLRHKWFLDMILHSRMSFYFV